MQFPLITEYVRAIEEATENLDKLAHLTPVLDNHGEPFRSSGAFAVVFKMKDEQTGKCYALKCFTEDQTGRAEAYQKIAEELDMVDSTYVTSVKYLENEIFVDSTCENEEFPVLLMDWVEGETMETYIANNYQNEHAMSMLCYRFCKLAAWLRSQPFAHGDIKPDNIMVRPDGSLTLVDYDSMFVPAMKGSISPTLGTKDFCHPLRTVNDFDETIDDFSLASIALSLKALSLNPTLLKDFGASDRLIFSADDYRDLGKSKVIASLQTLFNDPDFLKLYALFLLAHSQRSLSMCSFRLFGVEKPKEEEVLSTKVTKEDLEDAVEDEFGVKYSKDGKRLLKAPIDGEYTIRKGTKVICDEAFLIGNILIGDSKLTTIHIPDSVTNIGERAFQGCNYLSSIHIPDGVTSIENRAFFSCGSLTSIHIPDSVTSIGECAFSGCQKLTSITLPQGVKTINGESFSGWSGELIVKSDDFICEDGVLFDKYKRRLIVYRSKNKEYEVPNSVTSIGDSAFSDCNNLTSIHIPDSVTSIGDRAFYGCWSLTSIHISDSVTSIGEKAFSGCEDLSSIHIPDSVTSIGDKAFEYCRGLTSIHIPDSVTNIGDSAFFCCNNLTAIHISDSVTSIGESAFWGCDNLTSIHIPDSITSIGDCAFKGCKNLTSIHIPDNVTSIGGSAFSGCENLTAIHIPDNVTSIGDRAFKDCKKLTITLQQNIRTINENPFIEWNGKLIVKSKNLIYEDGVLFDKYKRRLIAYRSKNKDYEVPNSVTSIGDSAFYGCKKLTSIHIPNSVTSIGDSAFSGCENLTSIHIPDSVTSIADSVFRNCGLTSIHIPDSVTSIGKEAFSGCEDLSSIHIPDSVTSIGEEAFSGCEDLTSIHIPNGVTSIGKETFNGCVNLTSIHIPDSVTCIGDLAFYGCVNLTSIHIPDSVTCIGDYAFSWCNNLTSIHIPDSVTCIGDF